MKRIALTAAVLLVLLLAGGLAFVQTGFYNIAASDPHLPPVRMLLTMVQKNSVERAADGIQPPPLRDAALVQRGFTLYQQECVVCHGAPGRAPGLAGRGMNPNPPRLSVAAPQWSDAELYWIVRNGLRMAGMPAFETALNERDLWAVVAFVRRLQDLELADYRTMEAAMAGYFDRGDVRWLVPEDPLWEPLRAEGDAAAGKRLLAEYGCGTCHAIPGIVGASGEVGPPLAGWSRRHFIAGALLNQPSNLVAWITDPQQIEPGTVMPTLGVSEAEALNIAAYLYTLR